MTEKITLNHSEVKTLWANICRQHNGQQVYSRSITAYFKKRVCKRGLVSMGVQNADEWLRDRWMTPVIGDRIIFLQPERIGAKGTNPNYQAVVLAHELNHGLKFRSMGMDWVGDYFNRNGAARAEIHEAPSEASGADVRKLLGMKKLYGVDIFNRDWREAYLCTQEEASAAADVYNRLMMKHADGKACTIAGAIVCSEINKILKARK